MSSSKENEEAEALNGESATTVTAVKIQEPQNEPSVHYRVDPANEQVVVLDSPARQESSESSSDEDSDDDTTWRRGSRRLTSAKYQRTKWWFQEPAVKKNCCVVLGTWALLVLGITCFVVGLVLEVIYSHEAYRGIIFFAIGVILVIPGVYAIVHVYLAARRVGRVRFTSVWFFINSR